MHQLLQIAFCPKESQDTKIETVHNSWGFSTAKYHDERPRFSRRNLVRMFSVVQWYCVTDQRDDVVVRLFGVSMDGNSLCVQVHAFVPYFYVLVGDSFLPEYIERAKKVLNDNVKVAFISCTAWSVLVLIYAHAVAIRGRSLVLGSIL